MLHLHQPLRQSRIATTPTFTPVSYRNNTNLYANLISQQRQPLHQSHVASTPAFTPVSYPNNTNLYASLMSQQH